MQPLVVPVRGDVTAAQVEALIRTSAAGDVAGGADLLTGMDLLVAGSLTDQLEGGSVTRTSYAKLHGTGQINLARLLPWTSAIVRPYVVLSNAGVSARFNQGAYFTATPEHDLTTPLPIHAVDCYDILQILDTEVGDSFGMAAGQLILAQVEQILQTVGVVHYVIDPYRADATLPSPKAWLFADHPTWLGIINDLLGMVGYQGIHTDWDGVFWCKPYQSPRDRSPEWVYDDDPATSMLGPRSIKRDNFGVPNRWVIYQTNNTGSTLVEGAGMYTEVNETIGDTSVAGRKRVITRTVGVEAADQAALEAIARSIIDADMLVPAKMTVQTRRNPLHWHFDVVELKDAAVGPPCPSLVTKWTLALGTANQQHEWTLIE